MSNTTEYTTIGYKPEAGTLAEILGFVSYDAKPTDEHNRLQEAYDYYNMELFGNTLPNCLITLQRHRGARGYFWQSIYTARRGTGRTDEIAMNPESFHRTEAEILSTLVHEMIHLWHAHYGKPSRNGYHNTEWAERMELAGLMPSDTGMPGGKRTGQRVTHYVIEGGAFDLATKRLLADGFLLYWKHETGLAVSSGTTGTTGTEGGEDEDEAEGAAEPKAANPKNKVKYTCAECGQNAWAKPEAALMCGRCRCDMDAV